MMGGAVVFGVLSVERRLFEQELDRKRQWHEARKVVGASNSGRTGGLDTVLTPLRSLVTRDRGNQAGAGELPVAC
ncbi:MAG: hypothetical protein AB7G88_13155 [Thermomicrobiales bacterium]